jgi:hypothetical protein
MSFSCVEDVLIAFEVMNADENFGFIVIDGDVHHYTTYYGGEFSAG